MHKFNMSYGFTIGIKVTLLSKDTDNLPFLQCVKPVLYLKKNTCPYEMKNSNEPTQCQSKEKRWK